jgi:hypothetical protein
VAQLYPQALGTHFSRLLRHEWVTVGLFFNPGHHKGKLGLLIIGFEKFFLNPFQFITQRRHIFSFFAMKLSTQFIEQPCSKDGEIIFAKVCTGQGSSERPTRHGSLRRHNAQTRPRTTRVTGALQRSLFFILPRLFQRSERLLMKSALLPAPPARRVRPS